jgi:glycosyltransferase involved in cell wall biosynthesis
VSRMTILYITFIKQGIVDSGSSLRPMRMQEALSELSDELIVLSGEQSRDRKRNQERLRNIAQVKTLIKNKHIDLCYIESDTYPILLEQDYNLIKDIIRLKIPIAYFYRDCYRHPAFKYLVKRKGLMNRLKDLYLDFLQYRTDRLVGKMSLVYFPSELMSQLYKYKNVGVLPPAIKDYHDYPHENTNTSIYVGALSDLYGFDVLLDSFKLLNQLGNYPLILVCRKAEYAARKHELEGYTWLEVHHASGDALAPLYQRASIGLLPRKGAYNEFAVPVKLYEYLANGLPVISTHAQEMTKILTENNVGLSTECNAQSYAEEIKYVFDHSVVLKGMQESIGTFIANGNTWKDRAQKVIDDCTRIANAK